jgi:hypothetical protein
LLGCGGEGWASLAYPLGDIWCTAADTWTVRGFRYAHFSVASPDELLTATLHAGEVVPMRVATLGTRDCGEAVGSVEWISTRLEVADLNPTTRLEAELHALRPGETVVSAELTLANGERARAELYAVPSAGSPLLRVYSVRVVR